MAAIAALRYLGDEKALGALRRATDQAIDGRTKRACRVAARRLEQRSERTSEVAKLSDAVESLRRVNADLLTRLPKLEARLGREHPYGHGKAEGLAGMFQGSVIGFSGVYLVVESVRRLLTATSVEHTAWGLAVMAVSTVASAAITIRLRRVAKEAGSVALLAD